MSAPGARRAVQAWLVALTRRDTCLDADPTRLTVRVEADNEENLRRVQDIVTADLERFGRRDGVTVVWQLFQAADGSAARRADNEDDAEQDSGTGEERQDHRRESDQPTRDCPP